MRWKVRILREPGVLLPCCYPPYGESVLVPLLNLVVAGDGGMPDWQIRWLDNGMLIEWWMIQGSVIPKDPGVHAILLLKQ